MATTAANPTHIGRYEILSVIGRGGMGVVYKAVDPRIGRWVAIKVLTSAFDQGDALARFYREAKYTGSLQHQNIVTLYELGDQEGYPYLVMEYLEGRGLDAIIADKDLSIPEKLNIMVQVCRGLSFAHSRGIVHRDIKPANIVALDDGTAKIVDFGIAHVGGNRLTRTGLVMGSIFYMSPEQLNGTAELDCRTDIFSAGIVLFQLLTGALPFEGQDTGSTLLKIVNEPAPPLGKYLNTVPPELEPIVQRALAKRREDRYSSAEEFGFDLRRLQQQLSREQVALYLDQADQQVKARNFDAALKALTQALALDPDNATGKQRLADVQKEIEALKRKQAALELRSQAEEAFKDKRLDTALALVDEALQAQPDDTGLQHLRENVQEEQHTVQNYNRALDRAAAALNAGALEQAKRAIEDALAVRALDTRGRMLGENIAKQIQEQSRKDQAATEAKQAAVAINVVEKAMADARMFLFLNQRQEAREALVGAMGSALRVPQDLRLKFEALSRDLEGDPRADDLQVNRAPVPPPAAPDQRPERFSATEVFRSPAPPEEPAALPADRFAGTRDSWNSTATDETAIPEELREFLPPPPSGRRGFMLAGALAVVVAVGAWYWIHVSSNNVPKAHPVAQESTTQTPVHRDTYAEINAEPWGKVISIVSRTDQSVIRPDEVTPLRLSLPAGEYDVSVSGPGGETKKVPIQVPQEGGQSYFVVFAKPDIAKIVGAPSSAQ
ncbi:MAG TPA: protein kinase [Terriglobales bacterium]